MNMLGLACSYHDPSIFSAVSLACASKVRVCYYWYSKICPCGDGLRILSVNTASQPVDVRDDQGNMKQMPAKRSLPWYTMWQKWETHFQQWITKRTVDDDDDKDLDEHVLPRSGWTGIHKLYLRKRETFWLNSIC